MTRQGQTKLALASMLLPALALIAILATPARASAEESCYYDGEMTPHGACNDNDCWFWEEGVRCKNGGWYGDCDCAPIIN